MLGQGAQQHAVDAPRLGRRGDRREHVVGEPPAVAQQIALGEREVRVECRQVDAHDSAPSGITAVAISSIRAVSSNSRVTPNAPIAGK